MDEHTISGGGTARSENSKKTIGVISPDGEKCAPTYKKRALGLVKHGRARWCDENRTQLVLTRPPYMIENARYNSALNTEDNMNTDNINKINDTTDKTAADEVNAVNAKMLARDAEQATADVPSAKEILGYINAIREDNAHITAAISELRQMEQSVPGDIAGQAKAEALAKIVTVRETTNQKLLEFYTKLYDDIKPQPRVSNDKVEIINNIINRLSTEQLIENFDEISGFADNIRHINN